LVVRDAVRGLKFAGGAATTLTPTWWLATVPPGGGTLAGNVFVLCASPDVNIIADKSGAPAK
jgi:hypothetical protein